MSLLINPYRFTPAAAAPSPKVLLRAADITGIADGSAVGTWTDSSGNGYNATQATGTKQPIYRAGSGSPYLEFDGVDDFISIPYAFTAGQAFTVFVRLYSTETTAAYRNVFDGPTDLSAPMVWFNGSGVAEFDLDTPRKASPTSLRGAWAKIAHSKPAGATGPTYYANGATIGPGSAYSAPAYTPQWFNRGGGATWKGYVSEIRIYDQALSAAEVAAL